MSRGLARGGTEQIAVWIQSSVYSGSHLTLATINTVSWDGIFNRQTNNTLLRSGQYTLDTCVVTLVFAHVWPRTAGQQQPHHQRVNQFDS